MKKLIGIVVILLVIISALFLYKYNTAKTNNSIITADYSIRNPDNSRAAQLVVDARSQIGITTQYDGDYKTISYPLGDLPQVTGVCTDVVIRALRQQSVDLQELIHNDMQLDFFAYPNLWNLSTADTNIDHRRVPNILTYMERNNRTLTVTKAPEDYHPGDIVTWDFGPGKQHIGIISDRINKTNNTPYIIHNIGRGTEESDILFQFPITGHIRYYN
jgi:uncharacterized protein